MRNENLVNKENLNINNWWWKRTLSRGSLFMC